MQHILILGAGKSSGALIDYLSKYAHIEHYSITIADVNPTNLADARKFSEALNTVLISGIEDEQIAALVVESSLVISMLPAALHPAIAVCCLQFRKNLITPSYIAAAMQELHSEVQKAGLLFLNEMGLDPGIDHLSACEMIDSVQQQGGVVKSFKSHCGGLVAKESNDNPWGYKFSWNPRNVVLAGQGSGFIRWKENSGIQLLPYHRLFASSSCITIGSEKFDSYPNRDSLTFIEPYNLENAPTIYRGTLRYHGFCEAWNLLVQLGCCDDTTPIEIHEGETNATFMKRFIQCVNGGSMQQQAARILKVEEDSAAFQNLLWLELFKEKPLAISGKHTAASVLQKILEEKWQLKKGDKDRVVMLHEMEYELHGRHFYAIAVLDRNGNDNHTAMAETVGLPIGIAARMMLNNAIQLTGVLRPVQKEIYEPVLAALKEMGISFVHTQKVL
ncbi:MAG: saccharopine dehydrogenase NADP-binding domain-containing protein [Chitinophagales bacterium]|nr:saccharopine dehydrogenase NADP-binding domain-containing protein [Chitinophagales bacterium]